MAQTHLIAPYLQSLMTLMISEKNVFGQKKIFRRPGIRYCRGMKNFQISAAAVLVLCAFLSLEARAGSKGIAVLAVDNQAELSEADIATLFRLVEAPFKALPAAQYRVGTLKPAGETENTLCDEACMISKAGTAGADLAVCTTISTLGGRIMATLKLYDAKTGHPIAQEFTEPQEAIADLAKPVDWAARKLMDALPRPAPIPRPQPRPAARPQNRGAAPALESKDGILNVTTDPPGASVAVGGRLGQRYIGTTPLVTDLTPHQYRIVIYKKGYPDERRDVRILPGRAKSLHVELFKSKLMLRGGHAVFWPGVAFMIPAAALLSTDNTTGGIALFAVGGAVIAAGTALLITGAVRLRKEKKKRQHRNMASALQAPLLPAEGIYF